MHADVLWLDRPHHGRPLLPSPLTPLPSHLLTRRTQGNNIFGGNVAGKPTSRSLCQVRPRWCVLHHAPERCAHKAFRHRARVGLLSRPCPATPTVHALQNPDETGQPYGLIQTIVEFQASNIVPLGNSQALGAQTQSWQYADLCPANMTENPYPDAPSGAAYSKVRRGARMGSGIGRACPGR